MLHFVHVLQKCQSEYFQLSDTLLLGHVNLYPFTLRRVRVSIPCPPFLRIKCFLEIKSDLFLLFLVLVSEIENKLCSRYTGFLKT